MWNPPPALLMIEVRPRFPDAASSKKLCPCDSRGAKCCGGATASQLRGRSRSVRTARRAASTPRALLPSVHLAPPRVQIGEGTACRCSRQQGMALQEAAPSGSSGLMGKLSCWRCPGSSTNQSTGPTPAASLLARRPRDVVPEPRAHTAADALQALLRLAAMAVGTHAERRLARDRDDASPRRDPRPGAGGRRGRAP